MKQKKNPARRCAGCGQSKDKRELIRIVRDPEGHVSVDPTGRKSGRGVYLCPDPACLEKAFRSKALERSLQVPVDPSVYESLQEAVKKKEP